MSYLADFLETIQRDCLWEHKTGEHKSEFSMTRDDRVMTRDASREYIPVGENKLYLEYKNSTHWRRIVVPI